MNSMKNTAYSFSISGLKLRQNEMRAIGVDRMKEARQDADTRCIKSQNATIGAVLGGIVSGAVCAISGYAMKEGTIPDGAAALALTTFGSAAVLSVANFFTQREKFRQAKADKQEFDKAVVFLTRDPDDAQCPDTVKDMRARGILYGGGPRIS